VPLGGVDPGPVASPCGAAFQITTTHAATSTTGQDGDSSAHIVSPLFTGTHESSQRTPTSWQWRGEECLSTPRPDEECLSTPRAKVDEDCLSSGAGHAAAATSSEIESDVGGLVRRFGCWIPLITDPFCCDAGDAESHIPDLPPVRQAAPTQNAYRAMSTRLSHEEDEYLLPLRSQPLGDSSVAPVESSSGAEPPDIWAQMLWIKEEQARLISRREALEAESEAAFANLKNVQEAQQMRQGLEAQGGQPSTPSGVGTLASKHGAVQDLVEARMGSAPHMAPGAELVQGNAFSSGKVPSTAAGTAASDFDVPMQTASLTEEPSAGGTSWWHQTWMSDMH